jgi:thiamine biosynthesis protein ThiS|tara:strand:+ start:68 stop:286 length:219 start_codon:yes stop_codon:yes gene_type:complete
MKNKNKIKIKINGKKLEVNQSSTVASIVKKLNIPLNKVAIELNREIINKKKIKNIKVKNKDNLEIVYFIGGG